MTPEAFSKALAKLHLTDAQAAEMLGVGRMQVWRMQQSDGRGRAVSSTIERLVTAYLDGYRPRSGWPEK